MNKTKIKPIASHEFDLLYATFISYGNKTLSRHLGFVPNKQELKYHFFADPDGEPDLLLGAYTDNQLSGFIHVIRRPWKSSATSIGYVKWLQVNKQNKTIGRLLLNAAEQCLYKRGCKQLQFGNASPYYLIPGVPVEDKFTRSLLNDCGWHESSNRLSLLVNPAECDHNDTLFTQLLAKNSTYTTSNLTVADPELKTFISKYFSTSWALEVEFGLINIPAAHCTVLKNIAGDIVGFAAVHAVNRNWFGPMGIKDELRGRGLGKLILLHAMRQATENGINSLILSGVNDKAQFYRKIFPNAKDILFKKVIKT